MNEELDNFKDQFNLDKAKIEYNDLFHRKFKDVFLNNLHSLEISKNEIVPTLRSKYFLHTQKRSEKLGNFLICNDEKIKNYYESNYKRSSNNSFDRNNNSIMN